VKHYIALHEFGSSAEWFTTMGPDECARVEGVLWRMRVTRLIVELREHLS
jgi:hypothetical protein